MKQSFCELLDVAEKCLERCPWLAEMTVEKYSKQIVSEAHEVRQAVIGDDHKNLKEEIGDLLWVTLMLALLAEREGMFNAKESLKDVAEKMKRRKPYVFNEQKVTVEEAQQMWRDAKAKEKK